MAHTCPVCGQVCYCNGDIDDIILDSEEAAVNCTHCDSEDDECDTSHLLDELERVRLLETKATKLDTLRPEVLWFAREMERQLRKHDEAKGRWGWKSLTFLELYQLLDDEREELSNAFMGAHGSLAEMIHESADLANIAMMIADNARRLKEASPHA